MTRRATVPLLAVDGPRASPSAACAPSTTLVPRRARRDRRPDRPERLGQDHRAQPDLGRAEAGRAAHPLRRAATIAGPAAHRIARLGVARTFQLVRVLAGMDCRENVCAGLAFRAPRRRPGATRATRAAERCSTASASPDKADSAGRRADLYRPEAARAGARARAASPKLLLLDEWLAGLNPTELRGRHRADPLAAAATASPSSWSSM